MGNEFEIVCISYGTVSVYVGWQYVVCVVRMPTSLAFICISTLLSIIQLAWLYANVRQV